MAAELLGIEFPGWLGPVKNIRFLLTLERESCRIYGNVRVIIIDGEPRFVAADVCTALGLDPTATRRLDDDEKSSLRLTQGTSSNGGNPNVTVINESGLYSLVLGSRKPEAKAFKRWITHDVIPSIRRHGMYMTEDVYNKIADPRYLSKLLSDYADEIDRRKTAEEKLSITAPKASYYDHVLQSPDLVKVTDIAKDYGMSAIALNKQLAELGIQYKQGDTWYIYQKYADKGYTYSKTHAYEHKDGTPGAKMQTYWTQTGRKFIYDELKKVGIFPTMEANVM